jgi:hypothetical protein
MKYRKLEEPVFITNIKSKSHGSNGGDYWEIDLKTVRGQEDYKTYADPAMANWRYWEQIVEAAQEHGVVLSNCKVKDEAKRIVNADSAVKIEMVVLREILAQELAKYWDKLAEEQDLYRKFYTDPKRNN